MCCFSMIAVTDLQLLHAFSDINQEYFSFCSLKVKKDNVCIATSAPTLDQGMAGTHVSPPERTPVGESFDPLIFSHNVEYFFQFLQGSRNWRMPGTCCTASGAPEALGTRGTRH